MITIINSSHRMGWKRP